MPASHIELFGSVPSNANLSGLFNAGPMRVKILPALPGLVPPFQAQNSFPDAQKKINY